MRTFLITGDFNTQANNNYLKDVCDIYSFKQIIKQPTCWKNPTNPKCKDLLTNRQRSFQISCVIDTELSDFHKMTVTLMRSYIIKAEPKIIMYQDYQKRFSNKFQIT